MVNDQVLEHVRQQQQNGVPPEHIRRTLLAQGYSEANVEEVLGLVFVSISSATPQRSRSSKKVIIIGVVIACVVLLVGGGAYAYFAIMRSSEKVLGEMFKNLTSIYAYHFSGELTTDVNFEQMVALNLYSQTNTKKLAEAESTAVTFSGFVNNQDAEVPQSQMTLGLSSDLPEFTGKESLSIRSLGEVFYFNIVGLPPMVTAFIGSDLNNQWIKVDVNALVQQFGLGELKDKIDQLQSKNEPTDAQVKESREIFDAAAPQLVTITETLPLEEIDGLDSYHYGFIFDIESGKKLVDDLMAVADPDGVSEKSVQEYKERIDQLKNVTGEIWVGKKDYLPYKIVLYFAVNDESEPVMFSLTLSQHNVAETVEVPKGAKSIEEFFGELGAALFASRPTEVSEEAQQNMLDGQQDDDNDGLNNYREKTHKTDPKNPDTDGDGFIDGDEVKNHYNPLGPGKVPTFQQQLNVQ